MATEKSTERPTEEDVEAKESEDDKLNAVQRVRQLTAVFRFKVQGACNDHRAASI